MPSVLLGNRCVTFIRCLGGGALVSAVAVRGGLVCRRSGEGERSRYTALRGLNNDRVHFLEWVEWKSFPGGRGEKR